MNPEQSSTRKPLTSEQQQLVNNHYRRAERIADVFCTPYIGAGDLYGAAYEGLINAALNYDETREASFPTFMNKYIIGEILHTIRLIRGKEEFSVDDYTDDTDSPDTILEPSEDPSPAFDTRDFVNHLLSYLTPHERDIIENIYGLNGHQEHTVAEVAAMVNVSHTTIYQNIKSIMHKLTIAAHRL